MHLEYDISFTDFFKFQLYHQIVSPIMQAFFVLMAVFIFFMSQSNNESYIIANIVVAIISYILMWLLQIFFILIYYSLKKDHIVLTKQTLTFTETGIHFSNKYSEGIYYWNKQLKVIERKGYIYLYVSANMSLLLPRHAFNSKQQQEQILEFSNRMIESSPF